VRVVRLEGEVAPPLTVGREDPIAQLDPVPRREACRARRSSPAGARAGVAASRRRRWTSTEARSPSGKVSQPSSAARASSGWATGIETRVPSERGPGRGPGRSPEAPISGAKHKSVLGGTP
jgi:hypothetical protein